MEFNTNLQWYCFHEQISFIGLSPSLAYRKVRLDVTTFFLLMLSGLKLQAALAIRGFSIREFDYSRPLKKDQKPRLTREKYYFSPT